MDCQFIKIPPQAIQSIRKIYNLDDQGRRDEAIKILEDWIQKQDHIIKKNFSKEYLERTLITCKGSVEKAKRQIDRICTMKTLMPKFFTKTNWKMELDSILDMSRVIPLPHLTKELCRILVIEFRQLRTVSMDMFLKHYQSTIILAEYLKAYDYANGFIVINDFRDSNLLELTTKTDTIEFQQYVSILIDGYGGRLKALYYLTDSKALEFIGKVIKQLVNEKIRSRLHITRTLEELHESVPKEILPIELGGFERSIGELQKEFLEEISSEKNVEYLKMMFNAGTDETKRVAGKFNEEYMGIPGAFRNLTVD